MLRRALISPCGTYRHWLTRTWSEEGPTCAFVMLNPSIADGDVDDPTIRRCIGFAKREGCGALLVVNLYQLRATDPDELKRHHDPVGPDADRHLLAAADVNGPLIAAWGTRGGERAKHVVPLLGPRLQCLGQTRGGEPRHPVRLAASAALTAYQAPSRA